MCLFAFETVCFLVVYIEYNDFFLNKKLSLCLYPYYVSRKNKTVVVFISIFIRYLNQTELSFRRSGDYTPVIQSCYINKPLHREYTTIPLYN